MIPKLNQELSNALQASGCPLSVIDPSTNSVYVLIDYDTHQRAMAALRRQRSVASIQAGIDDMNAGRIQPANEAYHQGRKELLSRFR